MMADNANTADNETAMGKAAMDKHDYEAAIEHFGTALQLAITANGGQEDHPATAPFYARYGKALLEAAVRSASLCLVNEVAVEKSYGAIGAAQSEEPGKVIELSDDEDVGEDVEEEEENAEEDGENEDEEAEADAEEEEQVNDFDLAFQMLDMARLLYSRQEGVEARHLESAVLEDMADLSMETEEFAQAIEDYRAAIAALQQTPSTALTSKRAMAALHFKLGMASEYSGAVTDAVKALEEARRLIHSITADLDATATGKGKERQEDGDPSTDLLLIVKEVEGKLEELRSGKTLNTQGNLHEAMAQAAAVKPADAPVNDLSGLVKKRRVE